MNKVLLMGRLTKEPEVRYSKGQEPLAVAKYTLAVNRRFKHQGEPEADFINCVAFGKLGEFAEKYLKKGQLISIVGRLQVSSWNDQNGQKRWSTDVVVEEQYFAESKSNYEQRGGAEASPMPSNSYQPQQQPAPKSAPANDGFYPIDESIEDDDLPF